MTINRLESDKVNTKRVRNINNGDNQMRINAMNASKKQKGPNPCGFCTHRLKKEKPNHDFVHCYFNKNSTEYKGDKAKQNALDRAKKIEDEAKQKETQAIINTAVADLKYPNQLDLFYNAISQISMPKSIVSIRFKLYLPLTIRTEHFPDILITC